MAYDSSGKLSVYTCSLESGIHIMSEAVEAEIEGFIVDTRFIHLDLQLVSYIVRAYGLLPGIAQDIWPIVGNAQKSQIQPMGDWYQTALS